MPSANITVTAKNGPAQQSTAKLYSGMSALNFQLDKNVFTIVDASGKVIDYDYNGVGTITFTISGSVGTVAIS